MRLRLTTLLWLLILQLSAQACPVFPHPSLNGKSTVTLGSGSVWVSGVQNYYLPDGVGQGWSAVSDDGDWVVVTGQFGVRRFYRGKVRDWAPLPLPLIGRIRGGWLGPDGCYLKTDACDLWRWRPGQDLALVPESDLDSLLNRSAVDPTSAIEVAIQHQVTLREPVLEAWLATNARLIRPLKNLERSLDGLKDISDVVAAYRDGRSGRTSNDGGPPRLVSQTEWRRCQQALAQPSKETWPAVERLALAGRLTRLTPAQSQVLDATARLSRKAKDFGGLSLPALLALGYAEEPQAILDHLNWEGEYSSSYLELFTGIDCPAAVPGLIRQLAVAERTSLVRKALWRQLRVDLGPQPRAWEDWLSRPHHDPAERGQALLLAGDPCGLLWLGRTGTTEAARGLPRLLGRVGADRLRGQPWLEDSRVGFIPADRLHGFSTVREWCWSLKNGSPIAPLPEDYLYAGGDPRGGSFQVSPLHERAKVLSWGPSADGVYRLAPGHAVERPYPAFSDTTEARGDHRRYALRNGTLRMLDEHSGKELASVALRGDDLALQPGVAPLFLAVASDEEVLLLDPQTLRQLCSLRLPGWVRGLAFDAQGKRLAVTASSEISVYELEPTLAWSASEGELLSELWTGSRLGGGGAIALSPPEYWQRVARWEATTGGSWSEGRQPPPASPATFPWQSACAAAALLALLALLLWRRRQQLPARVHWT